jgi:hypothetical protein
MMATTYRLTTDYNNAIICSCSPSIFMAFMFIRIKEIMFSVVQKLCVYCEVGCDILSVSYMHFRI